MGKEKRSFTAINHIKCFALRRLDSLNLEMGNGSLESVDGLATSPFYGWIPDFSSPYYGGGGGHSRIDTLNEGRELYLHFFHEQLRSEGIDEAEACEDG